MSDQLDLLDHISRYPDRAGWKEPSTSRDAAEKIERSGRAERLRDRCLLALQDGGATGSELAEYLNESILSVRPRLSELKKQNLIRPSGMRREGQHVFCLVTLSPRN